MIIITLINTTIEYVSNSCGREKHIKFYWQIISNFVTRILPFISMLDLSMDVRTYNKLGLALFSVN